MRFLTKILLLTVVDLCIIGVWVRTMDPDPSVSIGIILLVPLVIVVNLLVAGFLYFVRKRYSRFFLINTVISAVIMNYLFDEAIRSHQRKRLETWEFSSGNKKYQITHLKSEGEFSMSERDDPGSSTVFLEGAIVEAKNAMCLITDSTKFIIRSGVLYGFGNGRKGWKLKKIDP